MVKSLLQISNIEYIHHNIDVKKDHDAPVMVLTMLVLLGPVPHVYGGPGHAPAPPVQHPALQHHHLLFILQLGLGQSWKRTFAKIEVSQSWRTSAFTFSTLC